MTAPAAGRRIGILLALVAAAALTGRRSLIEIRGPSMEPTLWPGDRLVTIPARAATLRPGQIVVLTNPQDRHHLVVKRISGVEDDRVTVHGDDPARSTDSRRWGPVPSSAVRRIVVARWPDVRSPLTRRLR